MTTKSEGMMIPGKLKWYVILALTVWLAFSGVAAAEQLYVNEGGWWREGGAFNVSGAPIQAAVYAAGEGDAIYVHGGNYYETVDVDKERLTLEGEGADVVTVTGAGSDDHVFKVTADYVNISGFTATGATVNCPHAGVYLINTDHCSIYMNGVSNNRRGICIYSSSNITLENNTVNSNHHTGIYLHDSSNNIIKNNTANSNIWGDGIWIGRSNNNVLTNNIAISNGNCGIYLWGSSNNTLRDNLMSENRYNFGISRDYIQDIDTSNMVNEKPIYYWVGQQDRAIPGGAGFVGVVNSTNITARDLILSNNKQGVLFVYTRNSRITNVTASDNSDGILLCHSSNNILTKNNASNNWWTGITICSHCSHTGIDPSIDNVLTNNIAISNGNCGIYLSGSSNNTLKGNLMSENRYNFGISFDYVQDMDTSNTVDGKPIYYWVNQQDRVIPSDAGFVGVVNSTNITVRDLTLTKNHDGVLFAHTDDSRIKNVTVSESYCGIELYRSSGNTLANNIAISNADGIRLYFSNDNVLTNNTASNNREGIKLDYSSNNTIHNNIANSNDCIGVSIESSSNNNLTCNCVQNNTDWGFYLQDRIADNNISCNNIIKNGNHNVTSGGWEWQFYNSQSNLIEAKHNYWGAGMNNTTIDASIYNDEEGGWGEVVFYPFETGPVPCAPTPEESHTFATTDVVIALQIATGSRPYDSRWDVSGDGSVTSLDALIILQAAAHAIDL